ncbi:hypothetical protein HHK36_018561 [Tetracentron sinense]|uniref:CBM20 domain-containing protein n=1 Tax=Tetracentron sinense TaxID=13715 RepID=A0A834Z1P8_TETSI|nr:hypothetical protein HHK36_018561 [Tetracentron sinense]
MEALTRSSSKIFAENCRDESLSYSRALIVRHKIRFLRFQKSKDGISQSVSLKHKVIRSIASSSSLSSEPQDNLENSDAHIQATDQSKTVHVKFQLQKECLFGEQFLLVGDDPIFGLWDPKNAIPLEWSDGNVWTVELDVAIGKLIQFKFIHKGTTGEILWQPGPDRSLQTSESKDTIIVSEDWESKDTIIVSEDWENAEVEKITEESMANQYEDPMINPDTELIVTENVTHPKEEPMANVDKEVTIADSITYPEEELMAIVAENIIYPKEEPMTNANEDLIVAENIHSSHGRAVSGKNPVSKEDENYDGGPIMVPGLTPLPTMSTEEASPCEDEKSIVANPSVEGDETKDHNVPKLGKQEPDGGPHDEETAMVMLNEEELDGNGIEWRSHLTDEQEQPHSEPADNDVLRNDIQWGRKTLQRLLSNLGFLWHQPN